jgi:hypothetical protein
MPEYGYSTASQAAQASLAEQFRMQQAYGSTQAMLAILAVWGLLDLRDVRSSWPAVRTAITALVRDGFTTAAREALAYYEQARAAAGVAEELPPLAIPDLPSPDLITATLDATGPYTLLGKIKAAEPVQQAAQTAGVRLGGAASRLILNGARQAVLTSVDSDAKAVGWMRVTASDPCAFCAMLASRGASYKSEQAAGFLAHNHCRCSAAPCWSREDAKALRNGPLAQEWQKVTQGLSGQDARNAWRRYWDAEHPSLLSSAPSVA